MLNRSSAPPVTYWEEAMSLKRGSKRPMRLTSLVQSALLAAVLSQAMAAEPTPTATTSTPTSQSAPQTSSAADQVQAAPDSLQTSANSSATAPGNTASPPATAEKAAAANTKPLKTPLSKEERGLIAAGYKVRIRDGQKEFCKTDTEIGSRLNKKMVCATADELIQSEVDRQDQIRRIQVNLGPRSN
jgi:hypothetical protein